jgi:ribosomal protein S27AE
MIKNIFLIKLLKSLYNYLFSFKIHDNLKTSNFKIGKQTTFLCSKCGDPFQSSEMVGIILEHKSPLHNQHLISNYFKILKYKKFYRGAVFRPQIHYYGSIKDREGNLISCGKCGSTYFQNILIFKILNINVAVLL